MGTEEPTISLGGSAPASPLRLEPGSTVGRYEIAEELGAGGMGVVYAAHDPTLDRRTAIKLLRPRRSGSVAPTEGRARLIREAQAMATVSHPNVVEVFDVGTVDDLVFIAMEFVDGETLSTWLERDRAPDEILAMFRQAGAGLAAAHRAGLVHRDFKPANVMVGHDGRARVLDFGLAAAPGSASHVDLVPSSPGGSGGSGRLTQTGVVMGTPAYMAPEQHLGRPPDASADQFSFCVALYQALYGQRPYAGETADEIAQHKTLGHIRPAPAASSVPRSLFAVLARGLAPDPAERFGSMDELLARLSRPHRTWRTAAAVIVGAAGLGALGLSRPAAKCDDGPSQIRERLSPARAAIHTAFETADAAYGAETLSRVDATMDRYAERWAEAHRDVCLSAAEVELDVLEMRQACLRRDLGQAEATLHALATGEAEARSHAIDATSQLPPPSRCSTLAPGDDVVVAAGLEATDRAAFEEILARHQGALSAGDYAQAVDAGAEAVALAERVGSPALLAKARFHLGGALSHDGQFEAARAEFEAAFFTARASSIDAIAEASATSLVLLVGDRLVRLDEAEEWIRHARTHLERSGSPPEREAAFLMNLAVVQSESGHPAEAKETHLRSLAILRELHGDDHPAVATELSNIAGCDEDMGNYDAALEGFQRSLTILENAYGPSHPELTMPLNNLGLLFEFTGKNEEALAMHERALELARTALGPRHVRVAKSLHNIGNVMRQMGRLDEAVRYYEEARPILVETLGAEHPTIAMVHSNLGAIAIMRGDVELGLEHSRKALEMRLAAFGPDHQNTGMSYGNLGNLYYTQGDYEAAAEAFGHAAEIFRKSLGERHPVVGSALTDLAMSQFRLEKYDEAIANLEHALELPDIPMEGPTSHATARFLLADALWESGGDKSRAIALAQEAERDFAGRGTPVEHELAEVRKWLAERQ